jgi:hypothetical protein
MSTRLHHNWYQTFTLFVVIVIGAFYFSSTHITKIEMAKRCEIELNKTISSLYDRIDVVYTWVNGSDPELQSQIDFYNSDNNEANSNKNRLL